MDEPVIQPCCDAWAKAHQRGTDNEGYGSLIDTEHIRFEEGPTLETVHFRSIQIGHDCDLPEVRFCPWCGHPKTSIQAGGN